VIEPTGLSWFYLLTAQVGGVLALVYLVALLGVHSLGPHAQARSGEPRN
jgi:hypothetical protein